MSRYVLVPDGQVSIELTPDEWAVALDALEKAHADRVNNGYSPPNKAALYRAARKFAEASEQLRALADEDNGQLGA